MIEHKLPVHAYANFFEHLKPEDLQRFDSIFSASVHFKDPFNDVHGLVAIKSVFSHMFEQCKDPRFTVLDVCQSEDRAYLSWDFDFFLKGRPGEQRIHGLSRVSFDSNGLVTEHIDYWDPAEQVYAKLPVLGWLLDLVKRRLSASAG